MENILQNQFKAADPLAIMRSAINLYCLISSNENNCVHHKSNTKILQPRISEPLLLVFAFEMALKAWCVYERPQNEVPNSQNLLKLFKTLSSNTQDLLDTSYKSLFHTKNYKPHSDQLNLYKLLKENSLQLETWRQTNEVPYDYSFPELEFRKALSTIFREFTNANHSHLRTQKQKNRTI